MCTLAITATALLTPLDTPARTTFDAIRAGARIVDRGIVPEETLASAADRLALREPRLCAVPGGDRAIRLAGAAAEQAVRRANWAPPRVSDPRTGLFVGTSKGPVLSQIAALQQLRTAGEISALLARQVALGPHAIASHLAEALGMTGMVHTSVAACSSGLHALHRAARALQEHACDRALVVAADASVHPLFEASFRRLGILARPDADGHRRCRPFDPAGAGFILSEAGAALTLEQADPPSHPPAAPPTGPASATHALRLEATWIGSDGTHLLAIDPNAQSLRRGLTRVVRGEAVAFVHAHATGTPHDAHELAAIRDACGPDVAVFSHKRYLGHSLGAAGLLALVLSAECHSRGMTLDGRPLAGPLRSVTISQGFGGHIGLAVLRS